MWTIWNYAQARKTSHGILVFLQLNHYALVRWLSDRALMSATLPQHRKWMCPAGRIRTAIIHVLLPSMSWTAPLISPDIEYQDSRNIEYQDSRFHSIAHLMCYHYVVTAGQKTFATGIRKWSKHLTDFPTPKFKTIDWIQRWQVILIDIYSHLCLTGRVCQSSFDSHRAAAFQITLLETMGICTRWSWH